MNDSKLSIEEQLNQSKRSRTSSLMSTNMTQAKIDQQVKNIQTRRFTIIKDSTEKSDKSSDFFSFDDNKPPFVVLPTPRPTKQQDLIYNTYESSSSINVNSELMKENLQTKFPPKTTNSKQTPPKMKINFDLSNQYFKNVIQKSQNYVPLNSTIPDKSNVMESIDYQYSTQQNKRQENQFEKAFQGKEVSIADSMTIFRCIDQKLINTPSFIESSGKEKQFQTPVRCEMEDSFTNEQEENARTLFSFLHCFPPSTLLKIIPTQYAIRNMSELDYGKLAIVPTEVLLDLKDSRKSLQDLVDSQRQIIQLLQSGAQQQLLDQALHKSQLLERKSKQQDYQSPRQENKQNCMIQ